MPELAVTLFGPLQVALDGQALSWLYSDKVRASLAYLVIEADRPHRRETLAGLLWPDYPEASARQSLSQTLFALRSLIDPGGATGLADALITASRPDVRLNGAELSSDAGRFDALLGACLAHGHPTGLGCAACTSRLSEALALFQGELLAGFALPDSPEFNEWLAVQRERWRRRAVGVASGLARAGEAAGGSEQAIEHARRWTELDSLDEEAHRCLMGPLAVAGRRTAALEQFELCRQVLEKELGIGPEPATVELSERIKTGQGRSMPAWETAPRRSAAAETPHVVPHNLPAAVDSFVGRERELVEVRRLLLDPAVRLVTLVGAGGMGKTRLALEVGRGCLDDLAGGVWFVDLAPLAADARGPDGPPAIGDQPDPARASVFHSVAGALGVREGGDEQALVTALQERPLLLLLDNCEHVLRGVAPLVAHLLAHYPALTVLATSREPLRIAGEHVYEVPPLEVPERSIEPDGFSAALGCSAVRLLAERSAAARYGTGVDETNVAAAVSLVRHLDGMPLAIELAAARLSAVTLAELVTWLEGTLEREPDGQRWVALASGSRAAQPRQQTLLNTVAWSYGLLTEAERLLFDRLSVFSGSFSIDAATVVCGTGALEAEQVPLRLAELVDCSLVQRLAIPEGELRYRLLETLRAYARERLDERGESEAVAARHAAYYVSLAEAAYPVLCCGESDCVRLLSTLDPERDNVSAAIRWSLAEGGGDAALRITGALHPWAESRNLLESYARWAQTALDLTGSRAQALALPRARALEALADYYEQWQLSEDKWRVCQAMLAAAEESQERVALARALYWEGTCAMARGDRLRGREVHERASAIAQECGEPDLALRLGRGLLITLLAARTIDAIERVVAGTPEAYRARSCGEAASWALNLGELARAEEWAREGTERYLALGSPGHAGATIRVLAEIVAFQGRLDEADALFAHGSRLSKENGDEHALMMMLSQRCEYAWLGMRDTARGYAEACLQERYGLGKRGYGTLNRQRLARAAIGIGERELGWRLLQEAAAERVAGDPNAVYFDAEARGWDAFLAGDMPAAEAAFRTALDVAVQSHWRIDAANTTERLAWALAALGETEEAAELLAEAERERQATGLRLFPVEIAHHERAVALAAGRVR